MRRSGVRLPSAPPFPNVVFRSPYGKFQMKTCGKLLLFVLVLLAFGLAYNSYVSVASAQGTAFTYQGFLNDQRAPANGNYDVQFALYDTNVTGIPVAGPVTNCATVVSNGLF